MVQEYQSPMRVYKYPFQLIMVAYERRFPRCPQIPVVQECVVTEDKWSADWSQRYTTRRCQLHVDAPYILKKMIGVESVFFIQKNHLDLKGKSLSIEATNESFSSRVEVIEKCRYFVHPENLDWTCFEQCVSLDVKSFYGFENAIEKIGMKQYSTNIAKGKEIIEYFVNEIMKEGITEVPLWNEKDAEVNKTIRELICKGQTHEVEIFELEEATEKMAITDRSRNSSLKGNKPNEDDYQLDAEYIQRYLGDLTVMQQSRLVQLRKWVADLQKGKVPSDPTLLRFLRARDFNVERAREMLSQSLVWRKKHQVGRILAEYQIPQVVKDYFPGGWHHHDKDGRPLYILRLGLMDVKGILKSIGEDGLLKLTLHICEEGLSLMEERTRETGKPIWTWCLLVDLEGLTMRHLWRPGIRALLRIIQIVEANYPETMGRVLIIRAPRVFPILWTVVGTFIDENTRSKFLFYGGKDYLQSPGGLGDYIPHEYVPDFLGGPCKTDLQEGGLVPKSLYLDSALYERATFSEDSIYRSVSLAKGQVHEVLVENDDPCSVLTWDFDVMRHDIAFSVYRSLVPVTNAQPEKGVSSGGISNNTHSDVEHHHHHRSIMEKNWTEGTHYHRVENTILCHDGESIQGSHVMQEKGFYIMQWRLQHGPPTPHAPPTSYHHHDIMDSFTQPKSQLMYFFEVLNSQDYRGSMSSLQSGTSGFSALSGRSCVSSCPSR